MHNKAINVLLIIPGTSLYRIDNNILYYEDNASMKIESLSGSELVFQVDLYDYNGDGQKDKFLELLSQIKRLLLTRNFF